MQIKSSAQAAAILLSLVNHRQKAYEAAHQQQKISSNHPAFKWFAVLKPILSLVANGETTRWNLQQICRQIAGINYIAKKRGGDIAPNQKLIIDACMTYLREQAYTTKTLAA